jgi:predicted ATPase/class 3 adenylate cyclase
VTLDSRGAAGSSPLPSGTVTLFLTDIEGSTQHWEQGSAAMSLALGRHNELLRGAIEGHGGHVFKTVGDAFCAAFSRASDAIAAAVAAQRAVESEDWSAVGGMRVRMALHSGTTDERDGDYFGPVVNRVARLLGVVHGGQLVLSGTTAQLLRGVMPEGTDLRDLGEHRLKDLVEPERVFQVLAPGLPEAFPPLLSLQSLPNNLPRQITVLIGRDDVVAQIEEMVGRHAMVTIVGTGGVGKTRVALQVGADTLDASGDGVWFVDLAPLIDPHLAVEAIAAVFGVRLHPERSAIETLEEYLKRKRLLLILDNCEHIVDEVARVAASILRSCPNVRLLATSREPLRIEGERVYRMPSLGFPPENRELNAGDAMRYGAVALFAERAAASDGRFVLSDESAQIVADICRRLDGIALAIELAAARVKVLAPRQLAQKLDERFHVLTGGSRTALPRQQTMRALIDWSYDLLTQKEQQLFRKLAVFAGGWTLETASQVCAGESEASLEAWEVLELISSLVDKSLVLVEPAAEQERYVLLESIRQYAAERLDSSGERDVVARAHATAYLDLAQRLDEMRESSPRRAWRAIAEPERENWRAALDWSLSERGETVLGQRLVGTVGSWWWIVSATEALPWVDAARKAAGEATPQEVHASLDVAEASLYSGLRQLEQSYAAASRAMERYAELDDHPGAGRAQLLAANALVHLGQHEAAQELATKALARFRENNATRSTSMALMHLATAQEAAGDIDAARALCVEALSNWKTIEWDGGEADFMIYLAELEFRAGNVQTALEIAAQALQKQREMNDRQLILTNLTNTSAYFLSIDRHDEAVAHAREALALAMREDLAVFVAWTLQHLAAIAALRSAGSQRAHEDAPRAARLLGFVDARLEQLGARRTYTEHQEWDRAISALKEDLGSAELERCMKEGRAWGQERAIAEALAIP